MAADAPWITQAPDAPWAPIDPSVKEFTDEISKRAKAAVGGIEAVGSMLAATPHFAASGLRGLYELGTGGDVEAGMKQSFEFLPRYEPKTEYGKVGEQALGHAFEKAGELGGQAMEFMAGEGEEDASYPIGQVAGQLALGAFPGFRGRGRPKPTAEMKAMEEAQIKARQPQPVPLPEAPFEAEARYMYPEQFPPKFETVPGMEGFPKRPLDVFEQERQAMYPEQPQPGYRPPVPMEKTPPVEPFEFGAREAIDFPLAREVTDFPHIKAELDVLRTERARLNNLDKTLPEVEHAIRLVEKDMREILKEGGLMTREDMARYKFWEPEVTRNVIEKSQTLRDQTRSIEQLRTKFENLEEGTLVPEIRSLLNKQRGYINPKVFAEGFNEIGVKLGGALRLFAFAARNPMEAKNVPHRIREYATQNSWMMQDQGGAQWQPWLRVVGIEGKTRRPIGLLELGRDGNYLTAQWVHVDPAFRGQGTARQMYTFARELGNDIRASIRRTPEGRKMWESFMKEPDVRYVDDRPTLPRLDKPLYGMKGPLGKQRGAIQFKSDPEYRKFKNDLPKHLRPYAKEMWKNIQKGLEEPKVGNEQVQVIKDVPGLDKLVETFKPLDEMKPTFLAEPDLPGGIIDVINKGALVGNASRIFHKINRGMLSGSEAINRIYDNSMTRWGTTRIRRAIQEADRQIEEVLYKHDGGIVPKWRKLNTKQQIEWSKLTIEGEGKKVFSREELYERGVSDKVVEFYETMRDGLNKEWDYANEVRVLQGHKPLPKREGYFPGKFMGDFYVTVTKMNELGNADLVGLYPGRTIAEVAGFKKMLEAEHPEFTVSEIAEKTLGYNRDGLAHAYGIYHDLQRLVESGSPESQMLGRLIEEFQAQEAGRTAGFYQHLKYKKGIEGASGRNKYKSDKQNAEDMMRTLQVYTHQVFEFGEFAKVAKDFKRLLNKEEFPGKPVAQDYLGWYFDRARGIESKFAQLQQDIINQVAHSFGISGQYPRVGAAALRSYMMWNFLSFHNTRFLFQQVMQPTQFLAQNLNNLNIKYGLNLTQSDLFAGWTKGIADMPEWRPGKPQWVKDDIKWAAENRVYDQSIMEDLNRVVGTKDVTWWALATGNYWIRATEAMGRRQAFLTFDHLLKDKIPDTATRRQVAKEQTDYVMTDYRPAEMPMIYRELGPIGNAFSALARFKHNYYSQLQEFLVNWIRNGYHSEYLVPLVTALTMQQLFGGLMGMPGREDVDIVLNLTKHLVGADNINNTSEMLLGSDWPEWMTHGLMSSITGGDLSASFGAGSVFPKEHTLMPLYTKARDIVMAAYEAATTRTTNALEALGKELLPASGLAQHPFERLTSEGDLTTDPKHRGKGVYRRTEKDWGYRPWSMRSMNESKARQLKWELERNDRILEGEKERLIERAHDDWKQGKDIQKYMKRASEFGMMPNQLVENILAIEKGRRTDWEQQYRGLAPKTPNQIRKYQQLEKYKER